ncbi:glycoside hydrolase family 125 protein [Enterococcus faecalis]|uniref:glycoside hydrolase family 125 protein n=1 Tax=Enterococcus TaxID=1350 RepID=UPI00178505CC|nr:glycoside hydrolase family 125 protein [Enterococcus faecalis]MBD9927622.1 glycoside hydrolase family 125 protein [Enterococcus faecalis]
MINQQELIKEIQKYATTVKLNDAKATKLFQLALVDTITNTTFFRDNGEIFIATGDIPAMWLRDSTFQILPYLEIVKEVPKIIELVQGVLQQQLKYIKHDPYANAFNKEATNQHYSDDISNVPISPWVWERKFEIDSLCAPIFLAITLYKKVGYTKHLTDEFWRVTELIIDTFIKEQHHNSSEYFFQRTNCPESDTLTRNGKGSPVAYTGLVWSGFRPSDDACVYGYFIPGNFFILSILEQLQELLILNFKENQSVLRNKITKLQKDIELGIQKYAILEDEKGDSYYAYEIDGLGNHIFMDDANIPSLLSLPFLGCLKENDKTYKKTREKILSKENPYYYSGKYLAGIGSPHTPPNYVWPISLAVEGLTSSNKDFVREKINQIAKTDAETLQCHEGIDVENPKNYTREWFSWANMMYCELVFHYLKLNQTR